MSFGSKKKIELPFFWKLVLGGAASCSAVSICHPIDVTKIRMQTTVGTKPTLLGTILKTYRSAGITAFGRGLTAAMSRQIVYSSLRYSCYMAIKDKISVEGEYVPLHKKIVASGLGGMIGSFFGSPNDLVLIRIQSGNYNYKNIFDGLVRIAKDEGVLKLWTGCIPTVLRGMVVTIGQAASYDQIKQLMLDKTTFFKDNLVTHFVASSLAGFLATAISSPVDVIKTRLMYAEADANGVKEYTGVIQAAVKIMRDEGFMGFYKGFIPNATRLVPVTIFTFMFYELYLKGYMKFIRKDKY